MSEDKKKVCPECAQEISDDELEQVAGGLTAAQMRESVAQKKATGTCEYM